MPKELNHLQAYLAQEFVDDYHEGHLTRRELFGRILGITGGVASAAALLTALGCAPAAPSATATTRPTDPPAKPTAAAAAPTAVPAKPTEAPAKPTAPAAAATAAPTKPAGATTAPTKPAAAAGTPAAAGPTGTPAPPATSGPARSKLSVKPDDPAITASDITFPGEGATLMGYLAQPKTGGPFPAVLVCHENRGLVEHVRDVTRRLAKAGYAALAVDLLSRDGGTAKVDPAQVPGKLTANPPRNVADFQAAFKHLQSLNSVQKANIGMVGFCFGGGVTWMVATAIPDLKAAVPYYGPNPPLADVPKIRAAILAMYGENDQRINAGIPDMEAAMKQNNKTFEKMIYPGAGHAFNNDTGPSWNEQVADDAWQKALAWFKKYLV